MVLSMTDQASGKEKLLRGSAACNNCRRKEPTVSIESPARFIDVNLKF